MTRITVSELSKRLDDILDAYDEGDETIYLIIGEDDREGEELAILKPVD